MQEEEEEEEKVKGQLNSGNACCHSANNRSSFRSIKKLKD
jgi:hypothetical protein